MTTKYEMPALTEAERGPLIMALEVLRPDVEKMQVPALIKAVDIALAALTTEPVAYVTGEESINDLEHGYEFFAVRDSSHEDELDSLPLYTAPPVPVLKPVVLPPVITVCEDGVSFRAFGYNAMLAALENADVSIAGEDNATAE